MFSISFKKGLLVVCASVITILNSNAADIGTGADFKGPIGLQLYTLRADFTRNVPVTLDKVRDYGVKEVELAGTYNLSPEKFKEMLDARGLKPISGHFGYDRYQTDIEGIAKEAKTLGLQYVGCAWIPHKDDFDEAECRDAIKNFNKAGEALAKHGLKFFYHTHGYEFSKYGETDLFDLLMSETNPKFVNFQMDVFWIVYPGKDPVALLKKYGSRWSLMHVKDMKKSLKTGVMTGSADVSNDVVVGTGQMNWPAILNQAKKSGVKHYFIEDESPDAAAHIPLSLKYLDGVRW